MTEEAAQPASAGRRIVATFADLVIISLVGLVISYGSGAKHSYNNGGAPMDLAPVGYIVHPVAGEGAYFQHKYINAYLLKVYSEVTFSLPGANPWIPHVEWRNRPLYNSAARAFLRTGSGEMIQIFEHRGISTPLFGENWYKYLAWIAAVIAAVSIIEAAFGGTPGKLLLGLRAIDAYTINQKPQTGLTFMQALKQNEIGRAHV